MKHEASAAMLRGTTSLRSLSDVCLMPLPRFLLSTSFFSASHISHDNDWEVEIVHSAEDILSQSLSSKSRSSNIKSNRVPTSIGKRSMEPGKLLVLQHLQLTTWMNSHSPIQNEDGTAATGFFDASAVATLATKEPPRCAASAAVEAEMASVPSEVPLGQRPHVRPMDAWFTPSLRRELVERLGPWLLSLPSSLLMPVSSSSLATPALPSPEIGKATSRRSSKEYTVAVHVRRGDVSAAAHPMRHLGDAYYIRQVHAALRAFALHHGHNHATEMPSDHHGNESDSEIPIEATASLAHLPKAAGGKAQQQPQEQNWKRSWRVAVHVFSEASESTGGAAAFRHFTALATPRGPKEHTFAPGEGGNDGDSEVRAAANSAVAFAESVGIEVETTLHLGGTAIRAAGATSQHLQAPQSPVPLPLGGAEGLELVEAWAAMAQADVLVTSKSSFSFVPALLRLRNGVGGSSDCGTATVSPAFWLGPLAEWAVAPSLSGMPVPPTKEEELAVIKGTARALAAQLSC